MGDHKADRLIKLSMDLLVHQISPVPIPLGGPMVCPMGKHFRRFGMVPLRIVKCRYISNNTSLYIGNTNLMAIDNNI